MVVTVDPRLEGSPLMPLILNPEPRPHLAPTAHESDATHCSSPCLSAAPRLARAPPLSHAAEWDKARLKMGGGDLEKGRQMLDARMLSRSPIQRWAAPDEIAQAVDFLCAEQSGLITGATIPVDGGLHLT